MLHPSIQHGVDGVRRLSSLDIRQSDDRVPLAASLGRTAVVAGMLLAASLGRTAVVAGMLLAASLGRTAVVAGMLLVAYGARDDLRHLHRRFFTASTTSNDGDDVSSWAERPVISTDIQTLVSSNVL